MKRPTGYSPRLFKICAQLVITAGIVLGSASALSAQDRLFAMLPDQGWLGHSRLIEVDTRPQSFGQIRKTFQVPGQDGGRAPAALGGGRFLVWLSSIGTDVHVFDTQTERVVTLTGVLPQASYIVAADAAGLRLFVRATQGILILDGRNGAIRVVADATISRWGLGTVGAYAPTNGRLFLGGQREPGAAPEIAVLDVDAGVVERTFTLPPMHLTGLEVDRQGSRLFVGGYPQSLTAPESGGVYVFDAQSGAQLAHHSILPTDVGLRSPFHLDESRRRMLAITSDPSFTPGAFYGDRITAFSLDTLAHLGTIESRVPRWKDTSATPFQPLTGPRSPLYVFSSDMASRDKCGRAELEARDPDSGVLQKRVDVLHAWGEPFACYPYLTLLSPPPAPAIQAPVVTGSRVTLSWTPSYDALHYDIEAGSVPGLSNLAVSSGHSAASFSIDGVPPGRYFVRVRAINWVGRSLPSNEIELVIP